MKKIMYIGFLAQVALIPAMQNDKIDEAAANLDRLANIERLKKFIGHGLKNCFDVCRERSTWYENKCSSLIEEEYKECAEECKKAFVCDREILAGLQAQKKACKKQVFNSLNGIKDQQK